MSIFSARRASDGPGFDVRLSPYGCRLTRDHFRRVESEQRRKALFKQSVKNVVLEISSYCNRRCGFCPNVGLTRITEENLMPAALFEKVVGELAEIDFDQSLLFHLYNEPLAAKDVLLERMTFARSRLPRARFGINTNGDYLTKRILSELDAAGCDRIFVSIYGPRHGEWDDAYIERRVIATAKRLGLVAEFEAKQGLLYAMRGSVGRIQLDIAGRNLWETGYDRGGTIPELSKRRKSPCVSPVTEFLVDHRGWVLPCCNVYTDLPDHVDHTLGRLEHLTIFDVYADKAARSWRDGLLRFEPGGSLCENCTRGDDPRDGSSEAKAKLDSVRDRLGLAAAHAPGDGTD